MNVASSSTSRSLCSSLGALRLSSRTVPSASASSSRHYSSDPPPPPSAASASSACPLPRNRGRKPKWTRADYNNREYVSAGLPVSHPDHERAFAPLKRKAERKKLEAEQKNKEEAAYLAGARLDKRRRDGSAWLSSEEFEEKVYREDLRRRKAKLALDEMLGTGAIARKKWAWEWFKEGKEPEEIGVKMATLADPPRNRPYPAPRMVEWILTHLSRPPRDSLAYLQPPLTPASPNSPAPPPRSKYTNSLHLLTPSLWDRLAEAHPSWAGYTHAETVATHLHTSSQANMALFDLLWQKGWRGQGMINPSVVTEIVNLETKDGETVGASETTEEEGGGNPLTTISGARQSLRDMWDKAGEDAPIRGEVMRFYLALPSPDSESVVDDAYAAEGWGAAESLEVTSEKGELERMRADRTRLAARAEELRRSHSLGGSAFAGVGVPESVKIAELLAMRAEQRNGGRIVEELDSLGGGGGGWKAKERGRKQKLRMEKREQVKHEKEEDRMGRGQYGFKGPQGSSPWVEMGARSRRYGIDEL